MTKRLIGSFKASRDIVVGEFVMTPVCQEFILSDNTNVFKAVIAVKNIGTSSLSVLQGAIDLTGIGKFDINTNTVTFYLSPEVVEKGRLEGRIKMRVT